MMHAATWRLATLASALGALGALVFALVGTRKGIAYFVVGKYGAHLGARLRTLHRPNTSSRIVALQTAVLVALAAVAVLGRASPALLIAVAVAAGPALWLEREVARRVARLDEQADGFATALANALKSTASIGAAIDSVAGMMEGPIAQEFAFAVKEMQLGKSLDEALASVGPRARSAKTTTVLASILIARQVGGNLSVVLERTAATLREMERLEGVVRQKTAESRAQMWAMTLAPFVICYGMMRFDENFFEPLTTSTTGRALVAGAVVSYVAALVVARKILAVDI